MLSDKNAPIVEFKESPIPKPQRDGSLYDQIVMEQIRERKAMAELGYYYDSGSDQEYQE